MLSAHSSPLSCEISVRFIFILGRPAGSGSRRVLSVSEIKQCFLCFLLSALCSHSRGRSHLEKTHKISTQCPQSVNMIAIVEPGIEKTCFYVYLFHFCFYIFCFSKNAVLSLYFSFGNPLERMMALLLESIFLLSGRSWRKKKRQTF